jgi:anti-anti-sigma factor
MPLTSDFDQAQEQLKISIDGRFDFSLHTDFRKAYEQAGTAAKSYLIDLEQASYLDSSALGMLLLLRDFAGGGDSNITIANCNDEIKKVFTVSNFQQLFNIN